MKILKYVLILSGLLLAGLNAEAQINCEVGVEFYANAGIKSCVLTGHHQVYTLQGIPLTCAHGKTMTQHPNGKLKNCILKEAQDLGGQKCAAGAKVEFDIKGSFIACRSG